MSLLSATAPDGLLFMLAPVGTDLLDIGSIQTPVQIGLRCGTMRCGTNRCGFGSTFVTVPADFFLDAALVDSL